MVAMCELGPPIQRVVYVHHPLTVRGNRFSNSSQWIGSTSVDDDIQEAS
jgi:hypothetical protein